MSGKYLYLIAIKKIESTQLLLVMSFSCSISFHFLNSIGTKEVKKKSAIVENAMELSDVHV